MIQSWIILVVALVYLALLFAVASHGDKVSARQKEQSARPNIYAFSLAIYCTTWTFFGSVGLAASSGISFLAIYIGPILIFTVGMPLLRRVINLSKHERITSVADFLGARYGKNTSVAAVAACIAVIGTIPYIALQLKAISDSVHTLVFSDNPTLADQMPAFGDISVLIALSLALFAILFGTRHADATEHQNGLMLAIAMESVVKLIAFLAVGAFVTFFMFDGVGDLFNQAWEHQSVRDVADRAFDPGNFFILTLLSVLVFLLLPRQFHVAVVENNSPAELSRARWLFPLYLIAINLFVIPIALAGMIRFGDSAHADSFVLLLPMSATDGVMTMLAFIGGLSAGTAMVVVASVALAIMISNDLVLPFLVRSRAQRSQHMPDDMEDRILRIRRTSILAVLLLAFIYYKAAHNSAALASIGLISFAAIAQLAPSFFAGLFWKRATALGAISGMLAGFCCWAYTLFLPTLLPSDGWIITHGLFGFEALRPQALFGTQLSPLANGVIWSLTFNTFAFVIISLVRSQTPLERMQAVLFTETHRSERRPPAIGTSTVNISQLMTTLSSYIGPKRTERALDAYWEERGGERPGPRERVDPGLLQYSEQLLAAAIGTSSSRLVHSLLIKRFDQSIKANRKLLDQASRALQFNRDVLQTALDQIEQGITVFDSDFRLASWNRQFRTILGLPENVGQVGIPLNEVARQIIASNCLEEFETDGLDLARKLTEGSDPWLLNLKSRDLVIEIGTRPMPEGGVVVTWTDITERVQAARQLHESNELLERRVEERTRELEDARKAADHANLSKTRFLAAAGHDILQPLNAARLYSATLQEESGGKKQSGLAMNIGRSLSSVEEILGSVLEISRLDSSHPEVKLKDFAIQEVFDRLRVEFDPVAEAKGLELRFVNSSKWVTSDPALLRRVMQNLISNAIKFTKRGKILVGCRSRDDRLLFQVFDTGIGIQPGEREQAFDEFIRLETGKRTAPGLGLGLSIVRRICSLLDHPIDLYSTPGSGTVATVEIKQATPSIPKRRQGVESVASKQGNLEGMHVLCIDNDRDILEGMQSLLTRWGCKVRIATSLATARRRIRDHGVPDLLLADYHLEGETGIDVVRQLRERFNSDLPAVLVTADRSSQVQEEASSQGLIVINKPVRPAALRALVSSVRVQLEAAE